ncbi:Cell division coordinator CpoB [Candidatus Entotheonellaceae bacterium PAL068K]
MGKMRGILWHVGLLMLCSVVIPDLGWGQEKPPIELPEVVIVGQEERVIQEEKEPVRPQTIPIGLKGDIEAGKIAQPAPPTGAEFAGPATENPGCLLFPSVKGAQDGWVYRRGIAQFNRGHFSEAIALFTRLLQDYPKSNYRGAATFWVAESSYSRGDEVGALQQYETVITAYEREPLRDYALFRAAQMRLRRQDYTEAIAYLEDLLAMYPASPTIEHASYLFGESAFRLGQFDQASRALGNFLGRFPQSVLRQRAELWRAESFYQLHRYQDAQAAYRDFLKRYGQGALAPEARYGLGWAILKSGDAKAARQMFLELAQDQGEARYDEVALYAATIAEIQQGTLSRTRSAWQRLQQRFPQGMLANAAVGELAWAYFARQDYAEALPLYRQLVQSQYAPQRLRDVGQYMIGECLYQQGDYAASIEAWRQIDSGAEAALLEKTAFRLGLALYHMREYAQAIQVLQAFVVHYASSEYHHEALFWLAESRFQQQDYAGALETYRRLPQDARLYDHALYGMGWVHIRLRQWPRALDAFQALIDRFPESGLQADALYRTAESHQNLKQYAQARQGYERYLSGSPHGPLAPAARLQLALLTMRTDRLDEAIRALRQVQQQFAGTEQAVEAQYWLGMTFFRRTRFAEARQILQELANTAPDHPRAAAALLRVADAYYNEKRYRDGLIAYQKVDLLHPQSPLVADARYGVILSYYRLQQYPQFLRESRTFIREFPQHPLSVSLLLQVAEHYTEQKRPDDAILTYNRLVRDYPNQDLADKALFRLGELYMTVEQPQQAIAAYERLLQEGQTTELKPDALLGQGKAYEALGQGDAALQRYTQIAEQYPESSLAARGLHEAGRVLAAQQKYREAQHYFETVVQQYSADPMHFASLLQWGRILLHKKRPEQAIELLQRAQQAPDSHLAAQVQLDLGRAYLQTDDVQQSINAYLRVAYLYPDETTLVALALRQAAHNYIRLGKCSEALTVYTKLLNRVTQAQETHAIQQEIERSGCH